MTTRIILAGAGNMGFAMLKGWLDGGIVAPAEVAVVEPDEALRTRAGETGARGFAGADALPADVAPELIVLAVKPQVIRAALDGYKRFGNGATVFLSVAAGTPISLFTAVLGAETPVIRCMPNTPAAIGKGMLATFANARVSKEAQGFVARLLGASGVVTALPREELMDAVTAVSGSGPAYLFLFIECLEAAARDAGLPPDTAAILARQTVWGSASLAAESPHPPAELRRQVTSPNGTTAAALSVLMGEDGLEGLLSRAVEAARERSVELGRG